VRASYEDIARTMFWAEIAFSAAMEAAGLRGFSPDESAVRALEETLAFPRLGEVQREQLARALEVWGEIVELRKKLATLSPKGEAPKGWRTAPGPICGD